MAYETVRKFTGTSSITGKTKLQISWDVAFTVKEESSSHSIEIVFDDLIAYSRLQDQITRAVLNDANGYTYVEITRESGTTGSIYKRQVSFSNNVETYVKNGTTYYARRASAPSSFIISAAEVNTGYKYNIRFYDMIYILDNGQATVGSLSTATGSLFYLPRLIRPTPSITPRLNYLNIFTFSYSPPSGALSSYLKVTTQYGAFGSGLSKKSDLYVSSSAKLTSLYDALYTLYWYPSHLTAEPGDFVNNVGNYEVYAETDAYSTLNFGSYPIITFSNSGSITYNELPPQAAIEAMTVSCTVTETGSYTGILSRYGKYIYSLSKLNLFASGSSSFGYGTTVTNTITLNGVSSLSSRSNYSPPVGEGSWAITCTDNHGVTKSLSNTWDTYPYATPQLTQTSIHRCNQDGTRNDNGDHVQIEWGTSVSPLGNQNSKSLTIVQPEGTSSITPATYEATGSFIVAADTDQSYNITFTLVDDFKSVTKTVRLSTAYVLIDVYRTGKGIAFGKVCERDEKMEIGSDLLMIMHTPGGQMIDVRASLIAGSVVYYTDPQT